MEHHKILLHMNQEICGPMVKLLNSSSLCSAWIKTNRASGILWPPPAEQEVWRNLPAMAMGVLTTTQYDYICHP